MNNFQGRSLLTLFDYTPAEIASLLDLAKKLKTAKKNGTEKQYCKGKNIVILFEKDSTRTRCAFEVAAYDQGMNVTYLGPTGSQMGKKESIKDTARVLGRMYDGIEYRGFSQKTVETLAEFSGVPVWNGLTDLYHPTQILADFLTIKEHFGHLENIRLAYLGDARNNMGNSLMIGAAKMGMDFRAVAPKQLWPQEELVRKCKEIAEETKAQITLTEDPESGCKDVDVIYTDVWVSMGEPDSVWKERIEILLPYQVSSKLMSYAQPEAIFLHCLPSFHNLETLVGLDIYHKFGLEALEVTDEVFESKQSLVFEEAENRLHTIKAVMVASLGNKE
ncbi:MAG: ornithine carbamoyltransferase [Acholeplasmataceae bacterium]|nr:ornithine carbamoyltransferase [Acholeplasmataceae bacterium]